MTLEMMKRMSYGSIAVSGRNLRYLHKPFFDELLKQTRLKRIILFKASDADIARFSHLPQLKMLILRDCKLAGESFKTLEKMPKLESITLQRCSGIRPENIEDLKKIKPLFTIEYIKSSLDRQQMRALATLPIKCLVLKESTIPPGALYELIRSRSLIYLDLQFTDVTDLDAHFVSRIPTLRTVKLRGCERVSRNALAIINKSNKRIILTQENPWAP